MKKNSTVQSAFFNPRTLLAVGLCLLGTLLVMFGFGLFTGSSAQAKGNKTEAEYAAEKAALAAAEQPRGIISVASEKNDTSPPLRNQPPWPVQGKRFEREANANPKIPHQHVDSPDPVVQNAHGSMLARLAPSIPSPLQSFDGIPFPGVGCNCAPPDTVGEVGATQYVQMVNEGLQVFNKTTGASLLGPVGIQSLWAGFGGVCETNGNGDPVVMYDQLADRWVITQFAGTSVPTNECIAISQTSDATGAYYRYSFLLGSNFFDYPHLAVWPDGYYMAMNVFNSAGTAYLGGQAFAFDRAKMLAGLPATFVTPGILSGGASDETFLPADLDGLFLPPAGSPATFVYWPGGASGNNYRVFHFHADFATPANTTFTSFASVPSAAFTELCPTTRACVPQLGGTGSNSLDGIADRLMYRLAYRKFSDGHEAVVGNFTVSSGGVAGIRWFELRNVTAGPVTLFQESTYQPDSVWRWMGSTAMDNQGNLALGFSASDATINPQIRYAGRLAGDPVAMLSQGEATMHAGTGSQTGTGNRWGDYSGLTVDPVNDCTFWYTQEYYATTGTFNWRTRIGSFAFTQCTAPAKGTAHFTVTECSAGALKDAVVSINGNTYGATLAGGLYDAALPPGSYSYSISKPAFGTVTGNFTITNGNTTNINVCLQGVPVLAAGGSYIVSAGPNNVLDPGETVTVALGLVNTSSATVCSGAALAGTLQATGNVTNPSGTQTYGVVCGSSGTIYRNYTFTVNPSLACGGNVTASLVVNDGAIGYGTFTYVFPTGSTLGLVQNFDGVTAPALPAGWVGTASGSGIIPTTVTTFPDTAPNSVFTSEAATVGLSEITTPVISNAGSQLSFRNEFNTEANFDGRVLEIAVNGGAFQDILAAGGTFVSGGYNSTLSTGFANPLPGRMAWTGLSGGTAAAPTYITTVVNLPPSAVGQMVQFKWRQGSDNSVVPGTNPGSRIDTVMLGSNVCNTTSPAVNTAVSRKTHGAAGDFDIALPLVGVGGNVGVECRVGATAGAHQIIVTFANPVTVGNVAVTTGAGAATASVASNVVTVNLTGVTDVQRLGVTLGSVSDGTNVGNIIVPMGVLQGDTNNNRAVSGTDAAQTKAAASVGTVDGTTFRSDVNANGSVNASDVSITKSKSGNQLP